MKKILAIVFLIFFASKTHSNNHNDLTKSIKCLTYEQNINLFTVSKNETCEEISGYKSALTLSEKTYEALYPLKMEFYLDTQSSGEKKNNAYQKLYNLAPEYRLAVNKKPNKLVNNKKYKCLSYSKMINLFTASENETCERKSGDKNALTLSEKTYKSLYVYDVELYANSQVKGKERDLAFKKLYDLSPEYRAAVRKNLINQQRKKIPSIVKSYYLGEVLKISTLEKEIQNEINEIIQNRKIDSFHKVCTEGFFSSKPGTDKYQDCLNEYEKKEITKNIKSLDIAEKLSFLPKEQRISETCIQVFEFKKGSNEYNSCILNLLMVDVSNQRLQDQKKIKELELEIEKIKISNKTKSENKTIIVDSGASELANELKRQRRQRAFDELLGISQSLLGGKNLGNIYSSNPRNFEGCFYKSSTTSGLNRICYYSCASGTKTKNIGAAQICPLNF